MNALAALLSLLLTAAPPAEQLGRQVKLKILVDKVLQQHGKWVTEEWMVKESAAAGFNVYSPRRGFDDLAAVKQVTAWCAAADIYHLVWMRGTLDAPAGAEAAGRRLVWANGVEQALWSPNSDEFWDWTTRYIVEYAKISATMPALLGVFLDYENYASNKVNNCYDLSYDQQTLQRFAAAQKVAIPELPTTERKAWLEGKGLHEAFATWQVSQWRERCRKLRQAVDAHNPAFRFCIYPAPGTPFMVEATYPEWSTAAAPLILGDPWTYGRSSRFQPQDVALEANRQIMLRGQAVPKEKGIPYLYTGGIDPVVAGADPEFSGKNALMLAEVSDGYWIFYEGPTYTKDDHKEYWKWFTWANKAMDEGRFAAWRTPRETPEDWSLAVFDQMKDGPRLVAPPPPAAALELPVVRLRRDNLLVLPAKAGQKVEVELENVAIGPSPSPLIWDLRSPSMARLTTGKIEHKQRGTVSFTASEEGNYLLGASAGHCAWSVCRANTAVGVIAAGGLTMIFGSPGFYFQVPADLKEVAVNLRTAGAETARVELRDPSGKVVASGQTSPRQSTAEIKAPATPGRWSLTVVKADEGVLEDVSLSLGPGLPPVFALLPEQAFGLAR